jgi:beta-N-acetylhexosaminidase
LWPSLTGTVLTEIEIALLKQYQPTGIVFFKRNMTTKQQTKELIQHINQYYPPDKSPTIAIDQEGGFVHRLPESDRGFTPAQLANMDISYTVDQYNRFATEAKELGIRMFFAPVLDILTNPDNPVVQSRCFGKTLDAVFLYTKTIIDTLYSHGIMACVKHFPGHGSTHTDSHTDFATVTESLETLETTDLAIYQKIQTYCASRNVLLPPCMMGHLLVPALDSVFPATLSCVTKRYLQNHLQYNSLVFSDDMNMSGLQKFVQENYENTNYTIHTSQNNPVGKVANMVTESNTNLTIQALETGCDILLLCKPFQEEAIHFETLYKAIQKNPLLLNRIQSTKQKWHIYQQGIC